MEYNYEGSSFGIVRTQELSCNLVLCRPHKVKRFRRRSDCCDRTTSGQYVKTSQANFGNDLIYSIDNNKPIVCHVMTGRLPNYNWASNTGHHIVSIGYAYGFQGLTGYSNVTYNDPHWNSIYFGKYTTSVTTMVAAINDNAGYYMRPSR